MSISSSFQDHIDAKGNSGHLNSVVLKERSVNSGHNNNCDKMSLMEKFDQTMQNTDKRDNGESDMFSFKLTQISS